MREYSLYTIHAELDRFHERPVGWIPDKGLIWSRDFPPYEAINVSPIAWRMNVFANPSTWAILFEEISVDDIGNIPRNRVRGIGPGAVRISNPPHSKVHFFDPIDQATADADGPFVEYDDEKNGIWGPVVRAGVHSLRIRGSERQRTSTDEVLARHGIVQSHSDFLQIFELFRTIEHDHSGIFFADPAQLRSCLAEDLPLLLRLDEWFHPDSMAVPSECETFRMIAEVMLNDDPSRYRPTIPPNTHWSLRPSSGFDGTCYGCAIRLKLNNQMKRRRRYITFTSLADISADVATLLPAHTTVGRWSLSQILNHLTSAFTWPLDGFPVRPLPLPIRLLLGKPGFAYMFHTGRIPQGLPLPKRHCPTPGLDLPTESARLTAAVARYAAHTGPIAIHPLAGQLSRPRYDRYQLIHSAHHLSFALPTRTSVLPASQPIT